MDDRIESANADEGADPTDDIRKQNPGETTAADLGDKPRADTVDRDDPHKVEKLAALGDAGKDGAEQTE